MENTGFLQKNFKLLIEKNLKELSSIESNLLGAENLAEDSGTFFVTSCHDKEGKTTSAISMAYGLYMQTDSNILLVDTNFDNPNLDKMFSVNASVGFYDYVVNDTKPNILETEFEKLFLLTTGETPNNAKTIYRHPHLKEKLNTLKSKFKYVIFDGSSVVGNPDTAIFLRNFDGVVVVVECEKTRWQVLQHTIDKVNSLRGNIAGVVLNRRKYYIPRFLYD